MGLLCLLWVVGRAQIEPRSVGLWSAEDKDETRRWSCVLCSNGIDVYENEWNGFATEKVSISGKI